MNNNSLLCVYIANNPTGWKENLAELGIDTKVTDNLAIFNYGIGCDFSNPLVQEARGIIIDINTLDVVCFPFRKFGNYGESYADKIDWASARVQEKVDGSIMKLYFYNGKWNLATNGTIDAYANVGTYSTKGKTFGKLFDIGAEDAGLDYSRLDPAYTYIFELVSPECPIVIQYPKTTIYHLGTRCNETGIEIVTDIGIKKPKEYHLNSLEDCIASAKMMNENAGLDALIGEGYVVVDKNWRRIKVKSPDYLQAHYCNTYTNPTDRRLLSIIRNNDVEEICTYFPAFREKVDEFLRKYNLVRQEIKNYIEFCASDAEKMDRKTFFKNHGRDQWGAVAASYYYNDHEEIPNVDTYVDKHLEYTPMDRVVNLCKKYEK